MRERTRVVCAIGVAAVLLTVVGVAAAAVPASASNVRLVDVEIEIVLNPETERGDAALDQAIVGDVITVLPVLELTANETVDPFEVEVYYVERHTGRSGRIGSGWVPGLSGVGAVSKPAVSWLLVDQAPGHYDLIVRGLFADWVDDAGVPQKASLKILKPGLFLELFPAAGKDTLMDLGLCPMGTSIDEMSAVDARVINLGTETASNSNVEMRLEYRLSGETGFTIYQETQSVVSVRGIAPGEEGSANLTILGGFHPEQFQGISALGTSNDLQFRLSILDTDGRLVSPLVVDTPRQFLTFYSPADAWTYPARPGCEPGTSAGGREQIAMEVVGGLVYHLARLADGTSVLGAHTVSNGNVQFDDWSPEPINGGAPQIVGLKVVPSDEEDPETVLVLLTATLGGDGYVYGVEGRKEPTPDDPDLQWFVGYEQWRVGPIVGDDQVALGRLLGDPTTFRDGNTLVAVVGSDNGLFAFDADSGTPRWHVDASLTQSPVAYSRETDGLNVIWFAAGSNAIAYLDRGAGRAPERSRFIDAGSPITTPLVLSESGTRVFFGTANSIVFSERIVIIGSSTAPDEVLTPGSVGISEIKGIAVVNGDDEVFESVVIYAATSRDVFRLGYETGSRTLVSEGSLRTSGLPQNSLPDLQSLGSAVGVLLEDAAPVGPAMVDAVFVVSGIGELRAYSGDFADESLIQLWGNEYVSFAFKSPSEGPLSTPIVFYGDTNVLLTQSAADGLLYAFSLDTFSPR